MKKNTILFGISIVNMVLFLIGMIILFAAAASGSADGNNFALILSIISERYRRLPPIEQPPLSTLRNPACFPIPIFFPDEV